MGEELMLEKLSTCK